LNSKIKTTNLLLSGASWLANKTWYQEIFDSEQVTNLAVEGSGNKYIAESVMSHIMENPGVAYVFVNWSGLNRIDIPLPLAITTEYKDPGATHRSTTASRYWTNNMAPWRDREAKIPVDERLVRLMYQEKGYTSVKSQSLLAIINLQNFLKARQIPYLFSFVYDYTNPDFDHNHLTGEAETVAFSTLGSVSKDHPMWAEIDQEFCLAPAGLDWAMRQPEDLIVNGEHLTGTGYRAWAGQMLEQYNITKCS